MKNQLRSTLQKFALFTLLLSFLVLFIGFASAAGPWPAYGAAFIVMTAVVSLFAPKRDAQQLCLNTLTNLIPDFYAALDVVSKELVGIIPAVQRDPRADRCALNATMRSHVAPANTAAGDVTPAMTLPTAAYQTIGNKSFTISKSRFAPFSWTGEEQGNVETGPGYLNIRQDQIAQAIRALTNEIEVDLSVAAKNGASRAIGTTAGTAPILADFAGVKKILDDNGAPMSDRHSVIDTTAGVALRGISNLFKVNEAGDSSLLRQGILGNLYGMDIRESAQIQSTTKGTGTSYLSNQATLPVGSTSIVIDTGSGTVVAGDIVTFTGDTNKYIVTTGVAAAGTIVIAEPGLRQTLADNVAMTIFGTSARNLAFTRNAILLGTRLPALPQEGDLGEHEAITDPRTGLTFELSAYSAFRMVTYHVSIAWGVLVVKPEHLAVSVG